MERVSEARRERKSEKTGMERNGEKGRRKIERKRGNIAAQLLSGMRIGGDRGGDY